MRIITGVLLGCAVLLLTWIGGFWFTAFCVILGGAVFYEWGALTALRQNSLTRRAGWLCYGATGVVLFVGVSISFIWLSVLVAALLLGALAGRNAVWVAGGYVYAVVLMVTLSLLREQNALGFIPLYFLFATVWGTDIGAYFCGRTLGGPKLAPRISPKKTWSGAVGGTLAGILCGIGVLWLMLGAFPLMNLAVYLLALLLSVVSQLGDLGESWIKRYFNVKDSGNILPGHGGVMDRVDGLVAAAAVFYLFFLILFVLLQNPSV